MNECLSVYPLSKSVGNSPMRAQTSPLLTLIAVVIGGAILFLILCAGVFLLVNPFRAPVTTTPVSGQRATVLVTQVVMITTTPAPTARASATNPPPPTNTPIQDTNTPLVPTQIPPTATSVPPTKTPTAEPTSLPNEPLSSLDVSTESGGTGMRVNVLRADGTPAKDVYVQVFRQKQDLSGNPVPGDRVATGYTNDVGTILFDVAADTYYVEINLTGYVYGTQFNHVVEAGTVRVLNVKLGQLLVGVLDAEGKAVQDRYVQVFVQKLDLGGNPVTGDRVATDYTDNTGATEFNLTTGDYRVEISGLAGELYGEEFNHHIASGETNKIIVRLGRLVIGLKDASGKPIGDRYVQVFLQKRDVSGNISQGERISSGYTQNTGLLNLELTAGWYIVEVSDIGKLTDVPIESGRITYSDGTNFELR